MDVSPSRGLGEEVRKVELQLQPREAEVWHTVLSRTVKRRLCCYRGQQQVAATCGSRQTFDCLGLPGCISVLTLKLGLGCMQGWHEVACRVYSYHCVYMTQNKRPTAGWSWAAARCFNENHLRGDSVGWLAWLSKVKTLRGGLGLRSSPAWSSLIVRPARCHYQS